MDNGRPRAAANIYKHGRLKTGAELKAMHERIMDLSFQELLKECRPFTQEMIDYLKGLAGGVELDLDAPLSPDDE